MFSSLVKLIEWPQILLHVNAINFQVLKCFITYNILVFNTASVWSSHVEMVLTFFYGSSHCCWGKVKNQRQSAKWYAERSLKSFRHYDSCIQICQVGNVNCFVLIGAFSLMCLETCIWLFYNKFLVGLTRARLVQPVYITRICWKTLQILTSLDHPSIYYYARIQEGGVRYKASANAGSQSTQQPSC